MDLQLNSLRKRLGERGSRSQTVREWDIDLSRRSRGYRGFGGATDRMMPHSPRILSVPRFLPEVQLVFRPPGNFVADTRRLDWSYMNGSNPSLNSGRREGMSVPRSRYHRISEISPFPAARRDLCGLNARCAMPSPKSPSETRHNS